MMKKRQWKLYLIGGLVLTLLFAFGAMGLVLALSIYIGVNFGVSWGILFFTVILFGFPFLYKTRVYQRIIKPYKKWDSAYWSRVDERRIMIVAISLIGGYVVIFMASMLVTNWLGLPLDKCLWISIGIPAIVSIVTVAKLDRQGWFYKK